MIPIFDLKYNDEFKKRFLDGSKTILDSGFIGEGKYVQEFEDKFKKLVNAEFSVACTSGTDALELALKSIDVSGFEVILPSNTFFATAVAVKNCGAKVILADCCKDDFCIDPSHVKKLVSSKTKAIITVHIGGIISEKISDLKKICDNENIYLIEDAAHAHLSNNKQGYAGTIGHIGCFSFFPTKVMTTGEGGMVTTNHKGLYSKIKSLKNFGRDLNDGNFCVLKKGINSKLNEFTGLLGSLECDRVVERAQKRSLLIKAYERNLNKKKYKIVKQKNGFCSYYKCILVTKNPEKVKDVLRLNKISPTGEVYKFPVHMQTVFKQGELKNTKWVSENHLCPPLYPELEINDIEKIATIINGVDS